MKLRENLQKQSQELFSRFLVIEGNAKKLLEYSQAGAHLSYTPHGLSHITAVETNYDWLLSDNDILDFKDIEIFMLLVATFFHDALMIPAFIGDEKEARLNHAKRAKEFLIKNYTELTLQLTEAATIGSIIEGHSIDSIEKLGKPVAIGAQLVDVQKLAACLSMADICHADESRAPWIVKAHLELDEQSEFHWRRHMHISGITRESSKIVVSAIVFSKEGENAVNEYKLFIEHQLNIIKPYFNTLLCKIDFVDLRITELDSPLQRKFQFQANMPEILNLLMGGVYSRYDVFLREIVQNSMDACLIKKAKALRSNIKYNPLVVITAISTKNKLWGIRVDDNGIGMDIKDIEDTVLWIGSSIGKNENIKEIVKTSTGKNLIATFGIGLLSCFRVAKKIKICTCKNNETPLEFEVSDISDTISPHKSNDDEQGTTILIEFDRNKYDIGATDLMNSLYHYFREINQLDLKVQNIEYSEKLKDYRRTDLFQTSRTEAEVISIDEYQPDVKTAIKKEIISENYHAVFWIAKKDKHKLIKSNGSITILIEGIFVKKEDITNWLPKYLGVFDGMINIATGILDITASRDDILKNEKYFTIVNDIKNKSVRLFENILKYQIEESNNEKWSLLITDSYQKADVDTRSMLLVRLDNYYVREYASNNRIKLNEIITGPVFITYGQDHYVEDLVKIDGKQLYHKQNDEVKLRASILAQKGETVLDTYREDKLLEFDMLSDYFKQKNIEVININQSDSNEMIERMFRSRRIDSETRELIGNNIKFIDIKGFPNKKVWSLNNVIWVNINNVQMSKIYQTLSSTDASIEQKRLAKIALDILSFKFDEVIEDIVRQLEN